MDSKDLEVVGEWPHLAGSRCDAILVEQYWHGGVLREQANVVWLHALETWHCLSIDCGIVSWRRSHAGPEPYEMPELSAKVRLEDVGHKAGMAGEIIDDVLGRAIPGGAEVSIRVKPGRALTFRNLDDHTDYYTG